MAEGIIGSFFTKINNEVEKQMNDDLKKLADCKIKLNTSFKY